MTVKGKGGRPKGPDKQTMSTEVNKEVLERLREYCKEEGRVMGWVIERSLTDYLEREGREIQE